MQFERYQNLRRNIDTEFGPQDCYFWWRDLWWSDPKEEVTDAQLKNLLDEARTAGAKRLAAPLKGAAMWVPTFRAVAIIRTANRPNASTLERLKARLQVVATNAISEFDSIHDQMTGLLNARAFEQHLTKLVDQHRSSSGNELAPRATTVTLIALDVDFFKQVNDTWGHGWGDLVLQSVADRLKAIGRDVQASTPNLLLLSRPSGEEFLIACVGLPDIKTERTIGQTICDSIAEQPLPSEQFLTLEYVSTKAASVVAKPKPRERNLTVSIGIASVVQDTDLNFLHELREKADFALNKAKTSGRNRICHFDDVMQDHAHVLHHHPETKIVTIDVGAYVGARIGQEFQVFHPDFVGTVPINRSDGRTIKQIGTYPRVSCGRLVVFDVQLNVSCCRVHENQLTCAFPAGSSLRAIAEGDFGHLISDTNPKDSLWDAPAVVKSLTGRTDAKAAAFDIRSPRGTADNSAAVHDRLATLYRVLREVFGTQPMIARDGATRLVLITATMRDFVKMIDTVLATFSQPNGPVVGVGFCTMSARNRLIRPESIIAAATCAAQEALLDPSHKVEFDIAVAASHLQWMRQNSSAETTIKKYYEFVDLGFASARAHNIASTQFWVVGQYAEMERTARLAVEQSPQDGLFIANLAVALYIQRNWNDAIDAAVRGKKLLKDGFPAGYELIEPMARAFVVAESLDASEEDVNSTMTSLDALGEAVTRSIIPNVRAELKSVRTRLLMKLMPSVDN